MPLFLNLIVFLIFLSSCAHSKVDVPLVSPQLAQDLVEYSSTGKKYVIAAQGKASGEAAKEIFAAGGNMMDAAVAVSFVISVERPQSTGLGGGGFLLYREASTGKVYSLDFRERAPLQASRDMFLDKNGDVVPKKSLNGIYSVAVPGLVAGLLELHAKFGKLPLAQVMTPAIRLAEQGFPVYRHLANAMKSRQDVLRQFPASAAIFLKSGEAYKVGEVLVQKDLAQTLRRIAIAGKSAFYGGEIAEKIVNESSRLHGILSVKDFLEYNTKWREPLVGSFHGYTIFGMPPPSSGGIHVQEILNILENDSLRDFGFFSTEGIHRTAAAMQYAFADRSRYPGDPDFVNVPVVWLTSKAHAKKLREKFLTDKARHASEISPSTIKEESLDTTHFSIMDGDGNMVSATETIDYLFGSGVVVPGTGIVLNDEMDDFSAKPGAANVFGALGEKANEIAPKKTPLSSMSPTLILKNGQPIMAVGAPGGTRIISCVTQVILNYLQYKLSLFDSVAAPRIHHQWRPDVLSIDLPGPSEAVVSALKNMGYDVQLSEDAVPCRVEAVANEAGILKGAADPRDIGISLAE